MKLQSFLSKYIIEGHDFVVWCPSHSVTLYDKCDLFEVSMHKDFDSLCIFDYMLVDSVCVNGLCIQINCHFQKRKWDRDILALSNKFK